jgi:hypothetical protein
MCVTPKEIGSETNDFILYLTSGEVVPNFMRAAIGACHASHEVRDLLHGPDPKLSCSLGSDVSYILARFTFPFHRAASKDDLSPIHCAATSTPYYVLDSVFKPPGSSSNEYSFSFAVAYFLKAISR